ncbi:hypothetical protein [Gracilimonas sp. BCB1]|uniref:hypothetical protein n=1 Tax=Gracilimonas sp. BCB1 TaxID=3152362 RepID=UPI0032D99135
MTSLAKNSGIWQWAMFSFVLAGLTGFVFRFGFVEPLPVDLNLDNVRHAHSHLMFFGWATLLPLYLIKLDVVSGYHAALGVRLMKNALWWIVVFSLLSFPAFLLYGYKPVALGNASLPLSVIFSGMVMLGWYGFMAGYWITRRRKKGYTPNPFFDGALVMLFVSSLGAWSVGILQMANVGGVLLSKALTHFFLATFIEGWVILVLMGLVAKALQLKEDECEVSPNVLIGLVAIGAPLTFPYGIADGLINFDLSVAARTGGVLIAEGVLLFVYSVIKNRRTNLSIWIWPLLFLVLKSVMQLVASVSPMEMWLSDHGTRILYLHTTLLGAFTVGVIWFLHQLADMPKKYFYSVLSSVALLIMSLVLMTTLWPASLSGPWIFDVLATVAIFPVIAVVFFWIKLKRLVDEEHHSVEVIRKEVVL